MEELVEIWCKGGLAVVENQRQELDQRSLSYKLSSAILRRLSVQVLI